LNYSNEEKELGFVLKRFLPQKQKFSVLTENKGRIELTCSPPVQGERLWPGMLIIFNTKHMFSQVVVASNLEVLLSPSNENKDDIYWLHALLELCYYSTLLNDPSSRAYRILYLGVFLLAHKDLSALELDYAKLCILTMLLAELGLFPHEPSNKKGTFNAMLLSYVDMPANQAIESLQIYMQHNNLGGLENIRRDLAACLKAHPFNLRFKVLCAFIANFPKGLL
jgi:hypothetical protein